MQEINKLLSEIDTDSKPRSGASQTEAGQNEQRQQREPNTPDLIDAINQIFAEFELAYHNQYHKAYGDSDRLVLTKKYWLECLADLHPRQLVAAARQLVKTQDFLPTISAVRRACERGHELFGLPSTRDAYIEACRAPAPKSACQWSHPAVYQAGKATDWFLLASEPEEKAFPVFSRYYQQLCDRVLRGEQLDAPVPPALSSNPDKPLSFAERERRLAALRNKLDV
ncbi:MAG TPA: hypothetical protein DEG76_12745 [Pseudohongiella sp.]|nr:hypothetical protein [Pseudohongiella sp.]HBX38101.1 hypothetical protein [Pseudohongiella sp.]|tara:strand:- start:1479 stop:2156 length:678 start_codon:yes stop_codon:yes gene_type:complete